MHKFFLSLIVLIVFFFNQINGDEKSKPTKYINVKSLFFSPDQFATVNSTKIPQLNCVNETNYEFCIEKYVLSNVTCRNENYEVLNVPDWICSSFFYKGQTFEKGELKCEMYEEDSVDFFIIESCYFNYTLKWFVKNNSEQTYWSEVAVIVLFVFLVLIVIVSIFSEEIVDQEERPFTCEADCSTITIDNTDQPESKTNLSIIHLDISKKMDK